MIKEYYAGVKIKIFPNEQQKKLLFKFFGLFRYVYNWGVSKQMEMNTMYTNNESDHLMYNERELYKMFSDMRKNDESKAFLKEIPVHTARRALKNVCTACRLYYKHPDLFGRPNYKSRKRSRQSFGTENRSCYIIDGKLKIEGFPKGDLIALKYHKYDNFGSNGVKVFGPEIHNPVISFDGDDFYLGFSYVETTECPDSFENDVIGIDLGVRNTFTISDGRKFQQPDCSREIKYISDIDRKIAHKNKYRRRQARREKTNLANIPKSKSQLKLEKKRRKKFRRIHNKRNSFYHLITTKLINENHKAIVIEKLGVQKMRKENPYISKELGKVSFYEIRFMFEYKSRKTGSLLIEADEQYPSSQICCKCGHRHDIKKRKIFKCPVCGNTMDRDDNAAINLKGLYDEYINGNYSNISFDWLSNYGN